jgi:hypothetical protein
MLQCSIRKLPKLATAISIRLQNPTFFGLSSPLILTFLGTIFMQCLHMYLFFALPLKGTRANNHFH